MNYIQNHHLDDKIVFQLLQIDQTFFVTCDFLSNFCSQRFLWIGFSCFFKANWRNPTIVFGNYINLLNALISKK
jgi:hypothetical protein